MVFWILIGLVVLAPLPFASVHAWAWSLMACVVGGLLIAWSAGLVIARKKPSVGLRSTWPFVLPFTIVVGWAVCQSLTITPDAWHHPLWVSAATTLGVDLDSSISLNPYATQSAMLRLLTYGGIFWLALQYCRKPKRAEQAIYALTIAGCSYATYGLLVWLTGNDTILWYDRPHNKSLTSTFINRNHYATYAGLTLIVISGVLLRVVADKQAHIRGYKDWLLYFLKDRMVDRGSLLLGWLIVMTSLLLSTSRAGFISTLLGLLLLCAAFGFTRTFKLSYASTVTALFLLIGVVYALSGAGLGQRLALLPVEEQGRFRVFELSLAAIKSAPLLGTGYGTFEEAFRFYQTPDVHGFYLEAHNTYIEDMLELGLPAALALFGTVAVLIFLLIRGLRRRRINAAYPCMGLAATVVVAAHSMLDFSLQIPAVAVTYSFLLGACCAQSWSSRKEADTW